MLLSDPLDWNATKQWQCTIPQFPSFRITPRLGHRSYHHISFAATDCIMFSPWWYSVHKLVRMISESRKVVRLRWLLASACVSERTSTDDLLATGVRWRSQCEMRCRWRSERGRLGRPHDRSGLWCSDDERRHAAREACSPVGSAYCYPTWKGLKAPFVGL